jgi:transcription termination/antitermination protein NusG
MKSEDQSEDTLQAYCVMCQTGAEHTVCERITQCAPDVTALVPVRVIEEKRNKRWQAFEKTLIPGYVFCYSNDPLPDDLVRSVRNIYKVLAYERGLRALHYEDRDYALWLYRHQGRIEPSTVLEEGQTITVIDGPLKDMTGKIVRLDKRKRKVWVAFNFDGEPRRVSLSAHVLTQESVPDP